MNGTNGTDGTHVTHAFKVGEVVTWMHYIGTRGTSMGFKQRRGRIFAIQGGMAYVKMGNGRETYVLLSSLDTPGEKTRLTQLAEDLGKGGGEE